MAESSSRSGMLGRFVQSLYIELLLSALAIRRSLVLHELKRLAEYFESQIFGPMLDRNIKQIMFHVEPEGLGDRATQNTAEGDCATQNTLVLCDSDGQDKPLPDMRNLAHSLARAGVRSVRIDARLDKGQIVETILLLLYVGRKLATAKPGRGSFGAGGIARAMLSPAGLHRLCSLMHFHRDEGLFEVQYYYSGLFASSMLSRLTSRFAAAAEYRVTLAAAPWAGLIVILAGVLAAGLWVVHWFVGFVVTVVLAVLLALATAWLVRAIGSVQFDSEHRDVVFKEGVRKITAMSHFPVTNPSPLMKLDRDGKLLFCNPATDKLLGELGFGIEEVEKLLPGDYVQWIAKALDTDQADDVEVSHSGRTFRFSASSFPGKSAVLVAGVELTKLKKLQIDLREANDFLEERVAVRTYELMLTQDVTIMSLSTLAESRDPVTGAHIARTRNYVKILAEHLVDHPRFKEFLSGDNVIEKLYRSAPLHDIGKVGTGDDILLKPGKLSDEEFERMKAHAIIGGDSLRWAEERLGSNSFLDYAREIAYAHHEKWDGSGYPYGLAGEKIPISARLMALADVYDALTNKRCYKPAFSHDVTRARIVEGKGTHFDPAVVEAFLEAEDEFKKIAAGKVDPIV